MKKPDEELTTDTADQTENYDTMIKYCFKTLTLMANNETGNLKRIKLLEERINTLEEVIYDDMGDGGYIN